MWKSVSPKIGACVFWKKKKNEFWKIQNDDYRTQRGGRGNLCHSVPLTLLQNRTLLGVSAANILPNWLTKLLNINNLFMFIVYVVKAKITLTIKMVVQPFLCRLCVVSMNHGFV